MKVFKNTIYKSNSMCYNVNTNKGNTNQKFFTPPLDKPTLICYNPIKISGMPAINKLKRRNIHEEV